MSDSDQSSTFSYSRVVVNSLSNYGGFVVQLLVGFFLLRYVIEQLGSETYSIIPLVYACIAYLELMGMGTGLGMGRHVSVALVKGDSDQVGRLFSSVFLLLAALSALLLITGSVIAWYFDDVFTVPPGLERAAGISMFIMTLVAAVRMPLGVLHSAFVATEKYWLWNIINSSQYLVYAAITIAFFEFAGNWVVWVPLSQMTAVLLTVTCQYFAARRILPSLRIHPSLFDMKTGIGVLAFSFAAFLGFVAGILYWDTDRIIINKFLAPADLTIYFVVVTYASQVYKLVSMPTAVLFPVVARAEATGNSELLSGIICRGTRTCVLLSLPLSLLFAALAEPFFKWYLGEQYQDVTSFVPLLAATTFVSAGSSVIRLVPVPFGRPLFVSVVEVVLAIANIGISIYFVAFAGWGLAGVALGTLVTHVIKNVFVLPWYVARIAEVPLRDLIQSAVLGCVPTGFALASFFAVTMAMGQGQLTAQIMALLVAAVIFVVATCTVGLHANERHRLLGLARRFTGTRFSLQASGAGGEQ